jgi:hypothetical protein
MGVIFGIGMVLSVAFEIHVIALRVASSVDSQEAKALHLLPPCPELDGFKPSSLWTYPFDIVVERRLDRGSGPCSRA